MNSTDFDLCIIGSGPAGIILALEYASANAQHKVAIVEYGTRNFNGHNKLDDTIVVENMTNHHTPYESTNKGLGGTSRTWGGRCVMFDKVDFIPRPILEGECTWDLSVYDEILKYTDIAAKYFECGAAVFDTNKMTAFRNNRIAENFKEGVVTDSAVERWSMPTRFGDRYAAELSANSNITLFEGYEAGMFSEPDATGKVSGLEIIEVSSGKKTILNASHFAIAAGAQESTRILLKNKQLFKAVGYVPDALGKYYQGHLSGKIASVKFYGDPRKTEYGFIRDADGSYMRRRFQFSTDFLVEKNLLNTAIWLDNPLYHDPRHKSGAMSFMYLAMITPVLGKKLAPPAIQQSVTKGKVNGVGKHILNVIKGLPGSLFIPARIFYKRYVIKRKLPGIFLYSPKNTYALHFHAEQVPDPANEMSLSPDSRALHIRYHLTERDINSVIKLHEELDAYLRRANCGELVYWFPKEELPVAINEMSKDGIHQSGTTRIADDAEKGVVDKDLKVFGTSNVYVCSSSAFPTSGQANPTFLLGAFAARLAVHLDKKQ